MKISTKGRYALRLMLDIALHCGEGQPVPIRDVAERQGLSDKYLEQIVTPLSRAGLVRSVRGAGGGYLLSRKPEEYTVGDILRVLEGDLAPVSCVENAQCCGLADQCVSMEVWEQIQTAINSVVDHITLADMMRRYYEKCRK
jgi:Rrf2 family protein